MSREINLAIKLVLFSTIISAIEQAPITAQEVNSRIHTRHRPFLSNLESRSFAKEPEAFFPETNQLETLNYPDGSVGRRSQAESNFNLLGQELQVKMGETTHADPEFDTFSRNEAQTDKVRVLIQIHDWNN